MKKLEKLESFRMKLESQMKITGGAGTTYWSASECTNYYGSTATDAVQFLYADGTVPGQGAEPLGHRMVSVNSAIEPL